MHRFHFFVRQSERFLSVFPGLNAHLAARFLRRGGLTVGRLFQLALEEARALAPEADDAQLVSERPHKPGSDQGGRMAEGSEAAGLLRG